MRNINRVIITETFFEVFEKIITGKSSSNQAILEWVKADIKNCFLDYDLMKNDLFLIWNQGYWWIQKWALLHCYNSDIQYTIILKNKIKKLDGWKCPYCNIDASRQVEHYLPKEEFPEFSFLLQNLIPSCWVCNWKKGVMWKDSYTRLYLNTYFDSIPVEQFLFVELSIKDDLIVSDFYIKIDELAVPSNIRVILNKHVKKLDLLERYSNEIDNVVSELKIRLNECSNINTADVAAMLLIEHSVKSKLYGHNYWLAVFYKEISENQLVLDYLCENQEI